MSAGKNEPRKRVAVIVALREELRAIEPALGPLGIEIARTGIGRSNAFQKAGDFLDRVRPVRIDAVIACGFGGGLREGLKAGDVIVAEEIVEAGPPSRSWFASPELLAATRISVERVRLTSGQVAFGRLATVARVLTTSGDKRRAREELAADIVDMESAGVLEAAGTRSIPVLCVRAVIDEHDFELPFDFGKILTPEGRPRILKAVGAIASNPAGLAKILPLRERAQKAARSLGEIIPELVEALRQ